MYDRENLQFTRVKSTSNMVNAHQEQINNTCTSSQMFNNYAN